MTEPSVGEALRAELGAPVMIRQLPSSPRSSVWLAEFDGEPAIVKQIAGDADGDARYAAESAALRIAGRADPPVVPLVLAADPGARVLVLEYLASQDAPPGRWMTEYAIALARLHATGRPADAGALPPWRGPVRADTGAFLDLAVRLGVDVPPGLAAELAGLAVRLRAGAAAASGGPAGAGYALLHGDPCPDNQVYTGGRMRFVDLEQAALGDGIVELAYLRAGFPTCWCAASVPGPVLREAEAAYRQTWRDLTGRETGGDIADACAGWLIRGDTLVERARRGTADHLARVRDSDWTWGTGTARQRLLHRLTVMAAIGPDHPRLSALARVSESMRREMLLRYPGLLPLPAATDDPVLNYRA